MEEYDLIQIWNIKDHHENGHVLGVQYYCQDLFRLRVHKNVCSVQDYHDWQFVKKPLWCCKS